jgi:hypothetical protein
MHEGFEPGTDRAFANDLMHSKGATLLSGADELQKMLAGFIRYLFDTDWKESAATMAARSVNDER